ncbi:MFS transporter [Rathayibacter sp. YIM 133350]|uniref:MFS transporter n=1 Tax=Rathayibacter sp. YIM 133350 TaxID=3131992 RepID=UPI00307E845D
MKLKTRVLVVAIVVSFVAFLDGAVTNVALPAIRHELGGGLPVQQWVVDGYLITLGALILLAGSLSDNFGRLRILRVGLYGFGITSIACALAPTGEFLVGARIAQGAAGALLVPSSLALIISTFPSDEQGKAIGRWTAWTTAAFLGGPALGGILVDAVSWRLIFGINILPIAFALWLMMRLGRDVRTAPRVGIDYIGGVLGVLGLAGPVFALIEQGRYGFGSPLIWVPGILGLACLAAFVWWEGRSPHPMMPLSLYAARNFAWGNLATSFIYAAIGFSGFALTVFLQESAGYSAFLAGIVSVPQTLMLVLLSSYFGGLSTRYGPRLFMTVGPLVAAAGTLYLLMVGADANYWVELFPGIVVMGLGMAMTVAPLTSAILGAVDPIHSGIGSAVNNAVARIAGLIAVACTGVIVGASGLDVRGYHRAVIACAVLLAIGGVVSWLGIRNRAPVQRIPDAGAAHPIA